MITAVGRKRVKLGNPSNEEAKTKQYLTIYKQVKVSEQKQEN